MRSCTWDMLRRLKHLATNLFIVVFMLTIFIDGIPSLGLFHDRLKSWVDPWIDVTGVWQGGWSVFAPIVDHTNQHLEVHIEYENGEQAVWRARDWRRLSALQKMFAFRELEYTENLELEWNKKALPEFARYWADQLRPSPGAEVKSARVTYHYFEIWPPIEGDHQPLPEQTGHWFVKPLYEEPGA